ncbi:MAG: hypothetical protein RLZZ213_1209, partial [Cyanobacteriota bacterium]
IKGPIAAIADTHWPGGEHGLCRCQALRLGPGLLACGFLLAQIRDLGDIGGQGVGGLAMEQQIELGAHRLQQLPAHGRGKGLEGSDVDGHGGDWNEARG